MNKTFWGAAMVVGGVVGGLVTAGLGIMTIMDAREEKIVDAAEDAMVATIESMKDSLDEEFAEEF